LITNLKKKFFIEIFYVRFLPIQSTVENIMFIDDFNGFSISIKLLLVF